MECKILYLLIGYKQRKFEKKHEYYLDKINSFDCF